MNYQLPRSTPEREGIPSSAVLKFVEKVEEDIHDLHSFMLLRHGKVVAEGWWNPYDRCRPHMLFSLSKSFTSTAVGFAVTEGLIAVDDPVLSFFPDDAPQNPEPNLSAMCIRHLLSMSTGHAQDTTSSLWQYENENWVKIFLSIPVEYEPGTHFVYNSGASYMLSAIIQKVTGQKMIDYLQPRLFAPLGIQDAAWETCPRGINTGGWGLSIKTEDIARFGLLYLQKGIWKGQRVLDESWIEQATTWKISNGDDGKNDWAQGYCYQFWRCRHGAYRGDGAFGQFCIVMPEQDAVMAITSGTNDMQGVLNLVWEYLLPAMENKEIPAENDEADKLFEKLSSLALSPLRYQSYSPVSEAVSGRKYGMGKNDDNIREIEFEFDKGFCCFTLRDDRGEHKVYCGIDTWQDGETTLPGISSAVAASGTWQDQDTFVMTLRFIETPFYNTITCHFSGDELEVKRSTNVSLGGKEMQILKGRSR